MSNVFIKRQCRAFNVDALNRTVKCEQDIDNGSVFALNSRSDVDGESMVWVATAPTANTDAGLWFAASPEVVITKDAAGNVFKGLSADPRAFVNVADRAIDAIRVCEGDLVEMTGEGITGIETTANIYLVPTASSFVLTATSTAGIGLCLKKVGTNTLKIGTGSIVKEPVVTYIYECVNN